MKYYVLRATFWVVTGVGLLLTALALAVNHLLIGNTDLANWLDDESRKDF